MLRDESWPAVINLIEAELTPC